MPIFEGENVVFTTPVKTTKSNTNFNDQLKMQLLEQFISCCTDPLLLLSTKGMRNKLDEQCAQLRDGLEDRDGSRWIVKLQTVMYEGSRVSWKQITSFKTMAEKMERSGLEGQGWKNGKTNKTGLWNLILSFVGDTDADTVSTDTVHCLQAEIMAEARKFL